MLPDSPRFLASVGRYDEAQQVLNKIRCHKCSQSEIDLEYKEIIATVQEGKPSSPLQFAKILIGKGGNPGSNLGRRAWLCIWLQIMASWTGITVSCSTYEIAEIDWLIHCHVNRLLRHTLLFCLGKQVTAS